MKNYTMIFRLNSKMKQRRKKKTKYIFNDYKKKKLTTASIFRTHIG